MHHAVVWGNYAPFLTYLDRLVGTEVEDVGHQAPHRVLVKASANTNGEFSAFVSQWRFPLPDAPQVTGDAAPHAAVEARVPPCGPTSYAHELRIGTASACVYRPCRHSHGFIGTRG